MTKLRGEVAAYALPSRTDSKRRIDREMDTMQTRCKNATFCGSSGSAVLDLKFSDGYNFSRFKVGA